MIYNWRKSRGCDGNNSPRWRPAPPLVWGLCPHLAPCPAATLPFPACLLTPRLFTGPWPLEADVPWGLLVLKPPCSWGSLSRDLLPTWQPPSLTLHSTWPAPAPFLHACMSTGLGAPWAANPQSGFWAH